MLYLKYSQPIMTVVACIETKGVTRSVINLHDVLYIEFSRSL